MTPASAGRTSTTVDPLASRLPVTVITGFLGSGKTTLLRRLLRHPAMSRAAVIINEFGEVAIDHELVAASSEQMTLLGNGCLCCTLRTDLQETLRELFVKRRTGEVIDFDRVFVETSGLADPVPVLHTLRTDGLLGAQYRLDGVVTLVDAVNGAGQLDTMPEAVRQAAVADRLVVTKTDIADGDAIARLRQRVEALNPFALCATAVDGELDPALLKNIGPRARSARADELNRWLGPVASDAKPALEAGPPGRAAPRVGPHDAAIRSFCLWFDKPFTWQGLNAALQALAELRGPDLLRVKGIVHVEGEGGPIVLQGAQHLFHPPVTLEGGHHTDPRSRIVFIVRNISRESVEALFAAVQVLGAAPAQDD
ncbi:MAG TPA: GTP-binding protein [Casimicrobiaceae bacterium]|nr:GTP-binding protein [Casimicrobiaceae bacterium]